MRLPHVICFSLILAAATLCAAQNNGRASGKSKDRGNKQGAYTLKIVGQYSGDGTSTVQYSSFGNGRGRGRGRGASTSNSISITATLKTPSGATGTVNFSEMPLVNDRFTGTANFTGTTLSISGRIDMPANTDPQQTSAQIITGRITALLTDSAGKGARLVAIQDDASRQLISLP